MRHQHNESSAHWVIHSDRQGTRQCPSFPATRFIINQFYYVSYSTNFNKTFLNSMSIFNRPFIYLFSSITIPTNKPGILGDKMHECVNMKKGTHYQRSQNRKMAGGEYSVHRLDKTLFHMPKYLCRCLLRVNLQGNRVLQLLLYIWSSQLLHWNTHTWYILKFSLKWSQYTVLEKKAYYLCHMTKYLNMQPVMQIDCFTTSCKTKNKMLHLYTLNFWTDLKLSGPHHAKYIHFFKQSLEIPYITNMYPFFTNIQYAECVKLSRYGPHCNKLIANFHFQTNNRGKFWWILNSVL